MAATLVFNDGSAATLQNGRPGKASRFSNWTPITVPIGVASHRQSDGARTMFRHRTQYGASLELHNIPMAATGGVRLVDIANRLRAHLLNGGTVAVTTDDVDSSTYSTCSLMPGTEPQLAMTNPSLLEYSFSLSLINTAGSPVAMVCHYVA